MGLCKSVPFLSFLLPRGWAARAAAEGTAARGAGLDHPVHPPMLPPPMVPAPTSVMYVPAIRHERIITLDFTRPDVLKDLAGWLAV